MPNWQCHAGHCPCEAECWRVVVFGDVDGALKRVTGVVQLAGKRARFTTEFGIVLVRTVFGFDYKLAVSKERIVSAFWRYIDT